METPAVERRKVYDPILRLIHWWNAAAVVLLLASGWLAEALEHGPQKEFLVAVHAYVGYGLILGLAARLAWGLVGPRHARFSDLWHPAAWWDAVTRLNLRSRPRWGHDELASAVYLAVYGLLLGIAATGLVLAATEQGIGPLTRLAPLAETLSDLAEDPHEVIANLIAGFIAAHLIALYLHQRLEKIPLAQSMITGYQYRPLAAGKEERHA